jgi:cell fate (sporulation/competence/biofilm development) regulator YlbF (YheA/YmcA/DUF963 family)
MNDIVQKAEVLGKAIAASERYQAMQSAKKAIEGEPELQKDISEMNALQDKLGALQRDGKPIEPEDKKALQAVEERVTSHKKFQQMLRTEADFSELMHRVNRAIYTALKN